MTTVQGSIAKLVVNSNAMFESLGHITTNIANMNTNGYKAQRFETYMHVDGSMEGTLRTDYKTGGIVRTGRELDIAIDGPGFIPITNKDGNVAYTRDGSFGVNSEGYLVASGGSLVGDGIKIPANYEKLKIQPDGTVSVLKSKALEFETVGKIPLVTFANPEGLEKLEGNRVAPSKDSGKPVLLSTHTSFKQNSLERANVDVYAYVNDTLKINGSLISSTRLVKVIDDIYRQSINLRQ